MMGLLRRLIYALGFRPKWPSIWYSPSRALIESVKDAVIFQPVKEEWVNVRDLLKLNKAPDNPEYIEGLDEFVDALNLLKSGDLDRNECNGAMFCGKDYCQLSSLNMFEQMRIVIEKGPRDCVKEWRERVGDTSEKWYRDQTGG